VLGQHLAFSVDDSREDLGPTHVDSDHEGSAHGRGLP
jgi:hypothetical protein